MQFDEHHLKGCTYFWYSRININKLFSNNIIRFYVPEWRLLNKLPRNLTCSNFVLILYVIRKPLKQPITTLLGTVVVFCSWSAFFSWVHGLMKRNCDYIEQFIILLIYKIHILYFDSRIKRLMILWKIAYALFAILDWYSPGLQCISLWSMIKLKAFFLGHWSIAISYRCRLDRTFIYNTRTQLKAQKSIMEMFYFFRNILRYATLEIFNLWMNDGNKTTFLRQIKFTGIFKWANAITMKIQIHLNILSLNESYLKRQCLST